MPVLRTARLLIRPLGRDDLDDCHALFKAIGWVDPAMPEAEIYDRRRSWLHWAVDNSRELARLNQPPLGERAVIDRAMSAFVGMVGFVPQMAAIEQLPSFGETPGAPVRMHLGMFWATSPEHQHKGFAREAARAMLDYAFGEMRVDRVIATTEHDNAASAAVMRASGMTVERNPYPEPFWFQTMGWIDAPSG
jgi:[ribosomal protein S5]-alanine N-acetyltransferase